VKAGALLSQAAQFRRHAAEGIPASSCFLRRGGMLRRFAAPPGQGQARGDHGVRRRDFAFDDQRERTLDELFVRSACHDATAAQAKSSASFASKPVRVETVVCSISSERSRANTREQSMAARSRCLATAISVMPSCWAISARVYP
jgi:hypothetical protein